MNKTADMVIEVEPTSVKSIKAVANRPLIENVDICNYYVWNDDIGEYEDKIGFDLVKSDFVLEVTYKNGKTEIFDADDIFDGDRRYIVPTGESVTLTGVYANSRMTDTWFEMTTYDGNFPCWLKKSHIDRTDPDPNPWASVKKPYVDADEKIVYEGDVRFSIVSRAWSHGWFKYENVWYDIGGSDNNFVFKFYKFFAWSTAPSGGDVKTVYTKSVDGNEYGLVHGKEFTVIGYIKQSGTGIYSITVNSKVYYTTATYGV
jgi:hypothetical protein